LLLLLSERLWNLIGQVIRSFYPALLLLRLADQKSPAMDKLYYYVRQMDGTIEQSKGILNQLENKISAVESSSKNVATKMMQYFLRSDKDQRLLVSTISQEDMSGLDRKQTSIVPYEIESNDDYSNNEKGLPLEVIRDSSDDDSEEDNEATDLQLGDHMEEAWKERSAKLRTDIAIAGWMCSADALVMKDVNDNHLGEHKNVVTELLKKWYFHEVGYNNEKMSEMINSFGKSVMISKQKEDRMPIVIIFSATTLT
jgi:hypothetical protein